MTKKQKKALKRILIAAALIRRGLARPGAGSILLRVILPGVILSGPARRGCILPGSIIKEFRVLSLLAHLFRPPIQGLWKPVRLNGITPYFRAFIRFLCECLQSGLRQTVRFLLAVQFSDFFKEGRRGGRRRGGSSRARASRRRILP
jgi:hypothetical protein